MDTVLGSETYRTFLHAVAADDIDRTIKLYDASEPYGPDNFYDPIAFARSERMVELLIKELGYEVMHRGTAGNPTPLFDWVYDNQLRFLDAGSSGEFLSDVAPAWVALGGDPCVRSSTDGLIANERAKTFSLPASALMTLETLSQSCPDG